MEAKLRSIDFVGFAMGISHDLKLISGYAREAWTGRAHESKLATEAMLAAILRVTAIALPVFSLLITGSLIWGALTLFAGHEIYVSGSYVHNRTTSPMLQDREANKVLTGAEAVVAVGATLLEKAKNLVNPSAPTASSSPDSNVLNEATKAAETSIANSNMRLFWRGVKPDLWSHRIYKCVWSFFKR